MVATGSAGHRGRPGDRRGSRAAIDAEVEQVLDRAERFALASPKLDPLDAQRYSYTDGTRPRAGVA